MEGVHLLYLGGALGGAIVRLYQNGGYDEALQVWLLRPPRQKQSVILRFLSHGLWGLICSRIHRHMICSRVLWTFKPLSRPMLKPRGLWYVLSSSKAEESCFRLPLSPLQVDLVRIYPFCTPLESPIFGVCSIATSCSSLLCDVQETICVWSLKVESKTDFSTIQENGNHLLVQIVFFMFYLIPYKPPLEMSFWNDFLPSWEPIESELLNLLKLSVNSFFLIQLCLRQSHHFFCIP